ncbi:MAG TPA: DNA translocase FtsK [Firmicutes bacterium]|nr:DNA translocase FtsK [Bacillota bacterium]
MAVHNVRDEIRQQIRAILIIALAALAFAALFFPRQTGEVGIFFSNVLRMLFGEVSLLLPVVLMAVGLQEILPWKIPHLKQRKAGFLLVVVILLVFAHLQVLEKSRELVLDLGHYRAFFRLGMQQLGGGVSGALLTSLFYFLFRDIGSYIVLIALFIIAFLLVTNISLGRLLRTAANCLAYLVRLLWYGIKKTVSGLADFFAGGEKETSFNGKGSREGEAETVFPSFNGQGFAAAEPPAGGQATIFDLDKHEAKKRQAPVIPFPVQQQVQSKDVTDAGLQEAQETTVAENAPAGKSASGDDYVLPPLKILTKPPKQRDTQAQKTLAERAKILEKTLESFGVKARVVDAQSGPTVTRYELQPETGVKVSKIVSLADDLALNLAAPDVRIEAPIPGKAAIGVEVPNKVIAPVYLREVLEDGQFQKAESVLTVALGKDITGNAVVADLMKMPHLLIAGSTGSGKSVCINVLIASILFKARPQEVKFVMIDPKVVELSAFNGIPHLLLPVVTDAKKASLALKNMLKEMSHRYEVFARENVRDIHSYNERKREQNEEKEILPYIVVIIDELADLMMVAAADVEDSIARLAQMARAAGIHLVIATQRPSVDVITGVIKANITSRIAFAVSSQADSRTILDMGGAEKLLGRGDALFHPLGMPKPFRIQGAFINERQLEQLLDFIRSQGEPEFAEQLLPEESEEEDFYEEDELFPQAVLLFAEAGTASISLLQRRFRIGYTRAARLVDDMERRGFVGKFEGSKAREVLITPEQARRLLFDRETM